MSSQIPNIIFFDKDRKAMCDVLNCALTDIISVQRQVVTIIDKLQPMLEEEHNDLRPRSTIQSQQKEKEDNQIRIGG